MFFVFGPSGQMYRGGPDQLAQVAPVRRVQRPQALRTRPLEAEEPAAPPPATVRAPRAPQAASSTRRAPCRTSPTWRSRRSPAP